MGGAMLLEEKMASRGGWLREDKAGRGVKLLTAGCGVMPFDGGGVVIGVEKASSTSRGDRYIVKIGLACHVLVCIRM